MKRPLGADSADRNAHVGVAIGHTTDQRRDEGRPLPHTEGHTVPRGCRIFRHRRQAQQRVGQHRCVVGAGQHKIVTGTAGIADRDGMPVNRGSEALGETVEAAADSIKAIIVDEDEAVAADRRIAATQRGRQGRAIAEHVDVHCPGYGDLVVVRPCSGAVDLHGQAALGDGEAATQGDPAGAANARSQGATGLNGHCPGHRARAGQRGARGHTKT